MTEKEFVINTFRTAFWDVRLKNICLYGTGKYTRILLEILDEFNFCGVADFGYEKDGWNGYPVLKREEIEKNVDYLVLITNPGNIPAVYDKIKILSGKVQIFSIEGIDIRKEIRHRKHVSCKEVLYDLERYIISEEDKRGLERLRKKLLHEEGMKIKSVYSLVNVFIAPWIWSYFGWFLTRIKESNADIVLMSSRDGWLFYRLCQHILGGKLLQKVIYFYTSRRCLSVASIKNESDVRIVAQREYAGSIKSFLEDRFGIHISFGKDDILLTKEELAVKYKRIIIENARKERECLKAYLQKEGIYKCKKILLFDFIGRGTVQYYLEKIIEKPIDCLYYFKMVDEQWRENDSLGKSITYTQEDNCYAGKMFTQRNISLLEAIITAPHGSVERIGSEGEKVVFREEERINKTYIYEVERACVDYYNEMGGVKELNLELADKIAGLLEYGSIYINEKVTKDFQVENSYTGEFLTPFTKMSKNME